jgi:tetratricopeptide (TPR) repeat protein
MARGGERGERHPSAAELEHFLLGEMSPRQAAPIISHLLSGCQQCRQGMAPLASVVFATGPLAPDTAPSSDAEYDFPMFKAFAAARQYASNLAREKALRSGSADRPLPKRPPALEVLTSKAGERTDVDRCEALLDHCRSLRYQDLEGMILSASLAVTLAERITARQGESPELADLEARAWAELGNAHRVADDMVSAETALSRALSRSGQGTGDPLLLARLMDLTASLYIDRRRFNEARHLLDYVHAIYRHQGDTHAVARTFISKGMASNLALDSDQAVGLLVEGLRQIDPARDPKLVLAAVHDLLWSLVDSGRATDANRLMVEARPLYEAHGEHLHRLPQLWLEGRIASQLGEDEKAEHILQEVRKAYQEIDVAYDAALVSLDLAAVWLRQGRTAEIESMLDESIVILRARNLQREALSVLLMLKNAFHANQATANLLRTAATHLWRLERFPAWQARIPN